MNNEELLTKIKNYEDRIFYLRNCSTKYSLQKRKPNAVYS